MSKFELLAVIDGKEEIINNLLQDIDQGDKLIADYKRSLELKNSKIADLQERIRKYEHLSGDKSSEVEKKADAEVAIPCQEKKKTEDTEFEFEGYGASDLEADEKKEWDEMKKAEDAAYKDDPVKANPQPEKKPKIN